jgi:hypothetical protein
VGGAQGGEDGEELLRAHARTADAEADGGKGVRWSYRRDYGDVRLLVLDSRGGRVLDTGDRSMVDAAEWEWIVDQTRDCASHLLLASSLPSCCHRRCTTSRAGTRRSATERGGGRSHAWPRRCGRARTSSTGRPSAARGTG